MTEQQIVGTLATKVMGWQKYEVELDLTDGGTQKFFDSWRLNGREVAYESWNPLKNIEHAWQVVEKMQSKGWKVMVTCFSSDARMEGYHVEVWKGSGGDIRSYSSHNESVKEAICNVAQKVVD